MVTVKLEVCFDSGQFAGGAKNLQDQCAKVIYLPKSLSIWVMFVNFGKSSWILEKFWSNAANWSEIYAIRE